MHHRHFQPVFFSPSDSDLRNLSEAHQALKQYRKFQYAEDILRKLKKKVQEERLPKKEEKRDLREILDEKIKEDIKQWQEKLED